MPLVTYLCAFRRCAGIITWNGGALPGNGKTNQLISKTSVQMRACKDVVRCVQLFDAVPEVVECRRRHHATFADDIYLCTYSPTREMSSNILKSARIFLSVGPGENRCILKSGNEPWSMLMVSHDHDPIFQ